MSSRTVRRWLIGLAVLAVAVVAAAGLYPALFPRPKRSVRVCIHNVKQIGAALEMYAEDNEGRLPPSGDLQRRLMPYVRYEGAFACTDRRDDPRPHYALDARVAGHRLDSLEPPDVVLVYEVDAAGRPVYPHKGGANYGFADGHWKWFAQNDAPAGIPVLSVDDQ